MYQFSSPQYLWMLLLFIPWAIFTFYRKRTFFEWFFTHLALFVLILGIAGFEFGEEQLKKSSSSCRLIIGLDVSKSMTAEDVLPSRFHEATRVLQKIIPDIRCEIALFPFTTNGNMLIPPTLDHLHVLGTLVNMNPYDFINQGTDFEESIHTIAHNIQTFQQSTKQAYKYTILLLSDGESHSKLKEGSLTFFKKNKIPFHTLSVGTQRGTHIIVNSNKVFTKASPLILQKISQWTNGKFFTTDNIQNLQKEFTTDSISLETSFEIKKNYSQVFFIISLILLCLAFSLSRWEYAIRSILFIFLFTSLSYADEQKTDIELYNEATKKEEEYYLPKAIELYEEALNLTSNDTLKRKALFNLANSHFKMAEFDKALEAYQQAILTNGKEPSLQIISENIQLALKRLKQQMQSQKDQKPSDKKNNESSIHDKEKIYKHIQEQEQQTQRRLNRNKKGNQESKTPW